MYDIETVTCAHPTACGPACLKMLLDYYGKAAQLDELIAECRVGVAGCSATTVKRVGDAHGLDVRIYKMSVKDVLALDRPAILWWRRVHYVVFCGLNADGEPVISNPSNGRFPVSRTAFERLFSGLAFCNGVPDDRFPDDYWGENTPSPDYFDD